MGTSNFAKCLANLSHTIRAVVEEHHGIVVTHTSIGINNDRFQKLIGFIVGVTLFNRLYSLNKAASDCEILYFDRVGTDFTLAFRQTLVSELDAFPAFISIHGIITPRDGSQLTVINFLHKLEQLL
jgi:hypothetical protein